MTEKKVLFIIHDVYQDDNELPLGIGYLAAVLEQRGVDVTVCCQDVYHYTNEELKEKYLDGKSYDLICMGFLAARFRETVLPLCEFLNKHKGTAKLVLGGHGASPIPQYILDTTKADYVVVGEAENSIPYLLDTMPEHEHIIRKEPVKHIDDIPFPAWHLFPMNIYTSNVQYHKLEKNEKAMQIITSRGCTNRCSFCYRLEKGIRFRSIDNVMDELSCLNAKYGITYFAIQDELFVPNMKRLTKFIEGLEQNNLLGKIKYNIQVGVRADIVDDEFATMLRESGCVRVNIGFESMTQLCLDEMYKNTTVEDNVRCADVLKKNGVSIGLNFIFGMPSDNKETLQKNVDFIKKNNLYQELRTIRPITPYPGSQLYDEAIQKGLLSGPDDFFNRFKNSDLITVNFTKYSNEDVYHMLYDANKELIYNHQEHSSMSMDEADAMIQNFYNLYFKGEVKFRGARRYVRKMEVVQIRGT